MDSVAIVTPIWKPTLDARERDFVAITQRTNPQIDKIFCAPTGLDVTDYQKHFPEWQCEFFDPRHFQSVKHYSVWLTEPDFYRRFERYEFICVCQADAVLVKDIASINVIDIDYLGAPWEPPVRVLRAGSRIYVSSPFDVHPAPLPVRMFGRKVQVGNGGLSVRRVSSLVHVTEQISTRFPLSIRESVQEDVLLCSQGLRYGLRVADVDASQLIFEETAVRSSAELPNAYGFHGLWRWNPSLAQKLVDEPPR